MGAIYLYDWYSRYAPSHLYEGIICGIEKSIISISIGIWREAQIYEKVGQVTVCIGAPLLEQTGYLKTDSLRFSYRR